MKDLIVQGRFDFAVSAGQASSIETYGVLIESLTAGSRFLREEFGIIPRAAWQVTSDDSSLEAHKEAQAARLRASSTGSLAELSFNQRNSTRSHPSAYARLFSDLGFEGLLIDQPPNNIDLEGNSFLWRASPNHFQNQKQIFTSVISTTDHGYCWPLGFDADVKYNPSDLFDQPTQGSNSSNADDKMIGLINHINTLSKFARGNQILLPFGCDYSFTNAALNYGQMDKLIQYFNANNGNNINL
jgi:lysosomal alpha-mannosidase